MPSKRPFGMVLATRCLENAFFNDASNEITTFDTPKAAKKGSKDKPKAARKQYKYVLRLARKTYGSDSVASGTEVAQGRGRGGEPSCGMRELPRKTEIFDQNHANRLRGVQISKCEFFG